MINLIKPIEERLKDGLIAIYYAKNASIIGNAKDANMPEDTATSGSQSGSDLGAANPEADVSIPRLLMRAQGDGYLQRLVNSIISRIPGAHARLMKMLVSNQLNRNEVMVLVKLLTQSAARNGNNDILLRTIANIAEAAPQLKSQIFQVSRAFAVNSGKFSLLRQINQLESELDEKQQLQVKQVPAMSLVRTR